MADIVAHRQRRFLARQRLAQEVAVRAASMAQKTGMRVLGVVGRDRPLGPLARRLLPFTWTALCVLVLTGGLLVMNRPGRYVRNDMFVIKMGLVILGVAWTLVLQTGFSLDEGFWERTAARRWAAKSGAVVALVEAAHRRVGIDRHHQRRAQVARRTLVVAIHAFKRGPRRFY